MSDHILTYKARETPSNESSTVLMKQKLVITEKSRNGNQITWDIDKLAFDAPGGDDWTHDSPGLGDWKTTHADINAPVASVLRGCDRNRGALCRWQAHLKRSTERERLIPCLCRGVFGSLPHNRSGNGASDEHGNKNRRCDQRPLVPPCRFLHVMPPSIRACLHGFAVLPSLQVGTEFVHAAVAPLAILLQTLVDHVRQAIIDRWIYATQTRIQNIQGTGFDLDVVIHRGAGAYICGEETALLTSLEGGKGFPRLKPPFPAISGLFECPTIVNNVETLACVPYILRNGAERFAAIGTAKQGGTRLFCVSGHVARPGVYEEPVSVTLRGLIEKAGGMRDGNKLKAVIPGGISAKILTADEIDVAMDFDSLMAAGTMAGSGGVIVMDETTSIVEALDWAAKFFAEESCGQCSPCREGTGWVHRILRRILDGNGSAQDLDDLLGVADDMEGNTICVFADAAAWPVQSYIAKFRDEFEEFIRSGREAGSRETAHA